MSDPLLLYQAPIVSDSVKPLFEWHVFNEGEYEKDCDEVRGRKRKSFLLVMLCP